MVRARGLEWGERIRLGIDEGIRVHDKLLLILSEHSVASQWVEQEVESALEQETQTGKTILFPVRLDDAVMTVRSGWPRLLRNTRNIADMRAWKDHGAYQRAFERLLRDLRVYAPGSSKNRAGRRQAGVKGLRHRPAPGALPKLSPEQRARIPELLQRSPAGTVSKARSGRASGWPCYCRRSSGCATTQPI